jgi:hypothetical protein
VLYKVLQLYVVFLELVFQLTKDVHVLQFFYVKDFALRKQPFLFLELSYLAILRVLSGLRLAAGHGVGGRRNTIISISLFGSLLWQIKHILIYIAVLEVIKAHQIFAFELRVLGSAQLSEHL